YRHIHRMVFRSNSSLSTIAPGASADRLIPSRARHAQALPRPAAAGPEDRVPSRPPVMIRAETDPLIGAPPGAQTARYTGRERTAPARAASTARRTGEHPARRD